MHSSACMNGQNHSQVGQPCTSQLRNLLTRRAKGSNNLPQYRPTRAIVQKTQNVNFIMCNGTYSSGQTSYQQYQAAPQQAVSSQQAPTGGMYNNSPLTHLIFKNVATQSSHTSTQIYTQQVLYQNSPHNSLNWSPPNTNRIQEHAAHQSVTSIRNQQVPKNGKKSMVRQDTGSVVDGPQLVRAQKTLCQNANRESAQRLRSYSATTTSPQHAQMPYTGTPVPATIHNNQTPHNQNHSAGYRPNNTQCGFSTLATLPSQMSQPVWINIQDWQANVQSGHFMHKSDMGQKTENSGREATPSATSVSNLHGPQYETSLYFNTTTNRSSVNSAATGQRMLSCEITPGNTDNVSRTYNPGLNYGLANNNTVHPGKNLQLSHGDRMTETGQTELRVALPYRETHNSNTSQSIKDQCGQALPKPTHGVVSPPQYNLDAQRKHCSAPKGFYVTVTEDQSGNGFKADRVVFLGDKLDDTNLKTALNGSLPNDPLQLQQFSERISPQRKQVQSSVPNNGDLHEVPNSSVKPNSSLNNTPPGHASQKAVAVVQPLSQKHNQAAQNQVFCETITDHCKDTPTNDCISISEKSFVSTAFAKHNKSIHLTDGSNNSKDDHGVHSEISNETGDSSLNVDSDKTEDPSQNQLTADEAESELFNKMQSKQCATLTAQQSLTPDVPVSQNSEMNKCESPEDPHAKCLDSPSSPLIVTWTIEDIMKLVDPNDTQAPTNFDVKEKLKLILKENHSDNSMLSLDKYKKLMAEVKEFCREHVTLKSVILSEFRWKSLPPSQLKFFQVLTHDYVPREVPYTSFWLNINDQLDDIDKEFGLPWSLRCHQLESDRQEKPIGTVNDIPAQIVSEKQNEAMVQTELEKVKLDIEKQASIAADTFVPAQTVSQKQHEAMLETEFETVKLESCVLHNSTQTLFTSSPEKDASSDPYYSFDIQVLATDEAKIIFEQGLSTLSESKKSDGQQEKSMNDSAQHELPEMKDVKSSEVTPESTAESPIEQFCCVTRWMEMILGTNKLSPCKCQCKEESSPTDVTMRSLAEAEEDLCLITPESKFDFTKEGKENADKIVTTIFRLPEECAEIIDLTEDDDMPYLHSSIDPKDISLISVGSSLSNCSVISESQIENLSSSESEFTLQLSEMEENCGRAQLNPTESCQSSTSAISETLIENLSSNEKETAIQMSDLKEDYGRAQLKPVDSSEFSCSVIAEKEIQSINCSESGIIQTSPLDDDFEQSQVKPKYPAATPRNIEPRQNQSFESKKTSPHKTDKVRPSLKQRSLHTPTFETHSSLNDKHKRHGKKRKRPKDPDRFSSVPNKTRKHEVHVAPDKQRTLEGVSERKKVFVDQSNVEPVATNVTAVKLVLFGSSRHKKRGFVDTKRRLASHGARAPEILTVNVTSSHRGPPEPVPQRKYSVKHVIHREWSKSFLPTKIKHRRKFSAQNSDFACLSDVGPKKPETGGPTNREGLSVSSERSSSTGTWTIERSLNLSKRRAVSKGLRLQVEKSKDVVAAKQPADCKKSAPEVGNHTVMPLQENNVLRFSVLPNTFTLQDGPAGRNETTDSTSYMPELDESTDRGLKITLKNTKGAWAPHHEKRYNPLSRSKIDVTKTSSLFHHFQRKYMEKTAIHG